MCLWRSKKKEKKLAKFPIENINKVNQRGLQSKSTGFQRLIKKRTIRNKQLRERGRGLTHCSQLRLKAVKG